MNGQEQATSLTPSPASRETLWKNIHACTPVTLEGLGPVYIQSDKKAKVQLSETELCPWCEIKSNTNSSVGILAPGGLLSGFVGGKLIKL